MKLLTFVAVLLMFALFAILVCLPIPSHGAVIGILPSTDGAQIEIHDDAQLCMDNARFALFTAIDGHTIPGCWLSSGPQIRIVFLDGDVVELPLRAIRKPTVL